MLDKPHILPLFLNLFNKFHKTRELMLDPLYIIQRINNVYWMILVKKPIIYDAQQALSVTKL